MLSLPAHIITITMSLNRRYYHCWAEHSLNNGFIVLQSRGRNTIRERLQPTNDSIQHSPLPSSHASPHSKSSSISSRPSNKTHLRISMRKIETLKFSIQYSPPKELLGTWLYFEEYSYFELFCTCVELLRMFMLEITFEEPYFRSWGTA